MNFVKKDDPNYFAYDIPLFIDPENKITVSENCDWNLGEVQNVSSTIEFNIVLHNCIERKRYDQAFFDSSDPEIQGLYNKATFYDSLTDKVYDAQAYFGTKIPMYIVPYSTKTDTSSENSNQQEDFGDVYWFDAEGKRLTTDIGIFPSAKAYVHTGVHVGDVNPNPGGKDYDTRPINEYESRVIENSKVNNVATLTGSGYRRGAIPYAYSIDLIFEITT
jgi:hypothetical protein